MPTKVFSGRSALIAVSTSSTAPVAFGALQGYTLTVDRAAIEVVHQDTSGWTENFPGAGSWSLTADTMIFSTAATQEQDTLRTALTGETRKYFTVSNSTVAGDNGWKQGGFGYVTGFSWTGDQSSPQVQNFTIAGDGALAESVA